MIIWDLGLSKGLSFIVRIALIPLPLGGGKAAPLSPEGGVFL